MLCASAVKACSVAAIVSCAALLLSPEALKRW